MTQAFQKYNRDKPAYRFLIHAICRNSVGFSVDCQCSLHKCNVQCNVRIIVTWTLIILGEISGTKGKVHEVSVWQTQGLQKICMYLSYTCTRAYLTELQEILIFLQLSLLCKNIV